MIYTKTFHIEIASRVSEISTIANLTGAYGNGKMDRIGEMRRKTP